MVPCCSEVCPGDGTSSAGPRRPALQLSDGCCGRWGPLPASPPPIFPVAASWVRGPGLLEGHSLGRTELQAALSYRVPCACRSCPAQGGGCWALLPPPWEAHAVLWGCPFSGSPGSLQQQPLASREQGRPWQLPAPYGCPRGGGACSFHGGPLCSGLHRLLRGGQSPTGWRPEIQPPWGAPSLSAQAQTQDCWVQHSNQLNQTPRKGSTPHWTWEGRRERPDEGPPFWSSVFMGVLALG